MERLLAAVILALLATPIAMPGPALAQVVVPPVEVPSERPAEVPFREVEPVEPRLETQRSAPPPVTEVSVYVRSVLIRGNTVLPEDVLREIGAPYAGRRLTSTDLLALQETVTLAYVERGYETSGAIIPDQALENGALIVQVIEGHLARLVIDGNRRFSKGYLAGRIAPHLEAPISVPELAERLTLLQTDPEIERVEAELQPGERADESVLFVRIVEGRPWQAAALFNDYVSPAIGGYAGEVAGSARSLTGWGDTWGLRGRFSTGLADVHLNAALPVTRWDTRLATRFRFARSEIVEAPFDVLDITTDYFTAGIDLAHPVLRNLEDEIWLGVEVEWRRTETAVGGIPFSFSEGADEGVFTVAPIRLYQEWVRRNRVQVVALRSMVTFGLLWMGATQVDGAVEDAQYIGWILQGQYAHRLPGLRDLELLARGDLQLVNDPVPPMEQFSLGGHASVRGYRENRLVRDNGFALSFEARLPLWRRPDGSSVLQLAPFADVGRAWNDERRESPLAQTLASAGAGLRYFPAPWLQAEFYWGAELVEVPEPASKTAQDYGIHFGVTATWP